MIDARITSVIALILGCLVSTDMMLLDSNLILDRITTYLVRYTLPLSDEDNPGAHATMEYPASYVLGLAHCFEFLVYPYYCLTQKPLVQAIRDESESEYDSESPQ